MIKHLFPICLFFITVFASSCRMNVIKGEGDKTTSTLPVTSFTAVDMSLPLKGIITVQNSSQPTVQLAGYENIIKHIRATVDNNTLHLSTDLDETWTIDNKDLSVTITLPLLTSLSLAGAGDADIHGNITGKDFKLDISGLSKVVIDDINVDNFSSNISGAGKLDIKGGIVKYAVYDISGAGKIAAFALQATETSATISGAGKSQVTALQKLTANINGAGTIKYKGHPTVTQQISGVGSIADAN